MNRAVSLRRWVKLWQLYAGFRQGQIAPSTYRRDYLKIERRLKKLKKDAPHLGNAIAVRDYLIEHYAADTARRTLQQLNACGKWAMESELVKSNPWEGIQKHIKRPPPGPDNWAAFTAKERDHIIAAFEARHPHLAPWPKFLFWTGCRPEEAAALRWEHIAADYSEIQFREARPVDVGITQATKNHRVTRFPCNARLQKLLQSLADGGENDRSSWVLKGPKGGPFSYQNFQSRYWRPLVQDLVQSGAVAIELSQYHCRHTWITLALDHLPPQDVSYLARVSVDVIYRHYVGRNRVIVIPEF
ncbi:MAG: tyrosine-type recombinase/integrase [Spirulina sp.]